MDDDEIEVTEEILSFHSNVRENIVSWNLHLKIAVKLSETKMKSERNSFLLNCKWAASFPLSGFKNVGQIEEINISNAFSKKSEYLSIGPRHVYKYKRN